MFRTSSQSLSFGYCCREVIETTGLVLAAIVLAVLVSVGRLWKQLDRQLEAVIDSQTEQKQRQLADSTEAVENSLEVARTVEDICSSKAAEFPNKLVEKAILGYRSEPLDTRRFIRSVAIPLKLLHTQWVYTATDAS